jgi:hypothetical protein
MKRAAYELACMLASVLPYLSTLAALVLALVVGWVGAW